MRKSMEIWTGWNTLVAASDSVVFMPCGTWGDTAQLDKVRCTWEMLNSTGLFTARPAIQFADVIDGSKSEAPAVATPSTYQSADDVYFPTDGWESLASTAGGKRLFRVGFQVKLSSGSTVAYARVAGMFEIQRP